MLVVSTFVFSPVLQIQTVDKICVCVLCFILLVLWLARWKLYRARGGISCAILPLFVYIHIPAKSRRIGITIIMVVIVAVRYECCAETVQMAAVFRVVNVILEEQLWKDRNIEISHIVWCREFSNKLSECSPLWNVCASMSLVLRVSLRMLPPISYH